MNKQELKNLHIIETYKSMIQFAMFGLRFGLIINGGAMIALLAFLGDISNNNTYIPDLQCPMYAFISGIVTTGIATIGAYMTQFNLFNEDMVRAEKGSHQFWFWFAISFFLASLACFCLGSIYAIRSF